ncbi:loganic acid O-methyltransferase-like isoform X1 [Salvia splendens]|uniref:loganic acid O-methyltransferase-like isoform X1 n=1 Tax=Salvia splendens TaxID=180675 RepID=UPI001C2595A2|nr:loganic acid O-methyltransferase-like isoform X1 [Salvia splendens]
MVAMELTAMSKTHPIKYKSGGVLAAAKTIIEEEIATKLDISTISFCCIADFGCSTGNNSFPAMHTIIEAVKRKYESSDLKTPDFYVWFNDVVSNDFNTLFRSLPLDRSYKVAAVAGDFHSHLLPPSSIHFAYSSWALQWLTEVPKPAVGLHSPAWKGGKRLYGVKREEVYEAYLGQFERDLEAFLKCRAVEMVKGGIMALLIPALPAYWDPQTEFTVASVIELLRSSLVDMAKEGKLSETKLDAFNFPYYIPTPEEVWAILQKSNSFSIERMEILKSGTLLTVDGHVACFRAVHQNMLTHEFGAETIDESFDMLKKKLQTSPVYANPSNDKTLVVVAILKLNNV